MSNDTSAPIPGQPGQPQQPSPTAASPTVPTPIIPPQPGPSPVPPSPVPPPPPLAWQPPEQAGWQDVPTQTTTPQSGFSQPGSPQPGFPQPGSPQPGFAQPGSPQPGSPQYGFPLPPASPPPPPPAAGRRRRPPIWALIVGAAALIGLVVGLLVWAPWSPAPQTPTAVQVSSPTATTALVSWTAPKGGATPSQYNVTRDGKEEGIVPGTQTSWTDTGLAPGSKHSYTVTTVGNGQNSTPSAAISVTTITPPPAHVTVASKTYTTVTLRWSPPPNAPAPDDYTVYDTSTGKVNLGSVDGSQTTYTVTQLVPGDDYSFAVTASWGSVESTSSPDLDAPPLSQPLSGSVPVNLKVTKILAGSTGLTVGEGWSDEWTFSASCPGTSCTLTDHGSLVTNVGQFTAKLTPSNGGYEGQATNVQFSHCGGVDTYETAIFQIYPNSGSSAVSNGAWNAWHGTMTLDYAGSTVSSGTCSGGDWVIDLTGTGS